MSENKWQDILGWNEVHLQEMRITGYAYLQEGRLDIARALFEGLTVLDSNNTFDLRTLGAIYLLQGDFLKSLKVLDHSLQLEPDHPFAKLNKAKALLFLGQIDDGLKWTEEVIDCNEKSLSNDALALKMAYGRK